VVGAIDGIAATHAGHSVLVVCHAGVINAYLAEVLGIVRSTFTIIENTSVTLVRHGEGQRIILAVNDAHHLYDPVLGLPG
jgi:2,3-bisphosphoglycerate-dependent phosphoglycerate mutase